MKTEYITSYALGELDDSSREAFEKELAASENVQRELRETADFCEELSSSLRPQDFLTNEQRTTLVERCLENLRNKRKASVVQQTIALGAIGMLAACLLIGILTPWSIFRAPQEDFSSSRAIQGGLAKAPQAELKPSQESQTVTKITTPLIAASPVEYAPPSPVLSASAPKQDESIKTRGYLGGLDLEYPLGRITAADQKLLEKAKAGSFNTETYDAIQENSFLDTSTNPLSTFSIDVDTASYSNVRRFLQSGQLPPPGAVRIEEMINYFRYDYPQPEKQEPFSVNIDVTHAPWAPQHELVRIGLKGCELPEEDLPPSNLVFLVDVSGSMQDENKLPLLKRSLRALVEKLSPEDRVAIVVYAGSSGLALPSTPGTEKSRILEALDQLEAGGSTNGAQGIQLAYETVCENFLKKGNNRVILCTDGDFNVGVTNQSELIELIEKERKSGVFLSVLGFGEGNLKDSTMEKLADKGNGNYAYIDSLQEGRKVLVEQMGGTLFTIAKDVKIQVEFNPERVAGYRLIGYENRLLAKEDFNDDKKDAGEIGAGHTVTALYELVPAEQPLPNHSSVDPLKYQAPVKGNSVHSNELLTVKLRYKAPDGDKSQLIEKAVLGSKIPEFDSAAPDFQFAAAVAAFGMKLRKSLESDEISWKDIQSIASRSLNRHSGDYNYRGEFLTLIEKAKNLSQRESHKGEAEERDF